MRDDQMGEIAGSDDIGAERPRSRLLYLLYAQDLLILVATIVAFTQPMPGKLAVLPFLTALAADIAAIGLRSKCEFEDRVVTFIVLNAVAMVSAAIGVGVLIVFWR